MFGWSLLCVLSYVSFCYGAKNIIFMLADDYGWDDTSLHGNSQIPTPNLDALARSGVIIDKNYVQCVCSPTRAAFMTGRSSIHTGVYNYFQTPKEVLSLNFTLLPQYLSRIGYKTHMVGKWHLGMTSWAYTPLERGFDTYSGLFNSNEDHYYHAAERSKALDLWNGTAPMFEATCWDGNDCPEKKYADRIFADEAIDIISSSVSEDPFFLYLSWQNTHAPLQAPAELIDSFNSTIENPQRQIMAAMATTMDNYVGDVLNALDEKGIREETLIIFTSDNGPYVNFLDNGPGVGSAWPLRGAKSNLFEGGVRTVGMISGGGISSARSGTTVSGIVHVSDWLKTLLTFAARETHTGTSWTDVVEYGPDEAPFNFADGYDQWSYLSGETDVSPRVELVLEAHQSGSIDGHGNSLIQGDWKIVLRTGELWNQDAQHGDGWYGGKDGTFGDEGAYAVPIGQDTQPYTIECSTPPADIITGFACEEVSPASTMSGSAQFACLFNLKDDPCEQQDLSKVNPDKLSELYTQLQVYQSEALESKEATRSDDPLLCPKPATLDNCAAPGDQGGMDCKYFLPCD